MSKERHFHVMGGTMKNIAGIFVLISMLLTLNRAAHTADYIIDTVGTKVVYQGEFVKNGQTVPYTKTLEVIDPAMVTGAKFDVIHHVVMMSDNFQEEKILLYVIKPDGIYLAATAKKMGGEITVLPEPSKEISLPLQVGAKWERARQEGPNDISLTLEVVSCDEKLTLNGKEIVTTKIVGSGSALHKNEQSKIQKETYYTKDGRVKQITRKSISETETTVDTFTLLSITPPAPASEKLKEQGPEGQGSTSESQPPKESSETQK
jgi:hypothetical protein